jgi:hypothetical protein
LIIGCSKSPAPGPIPLKSPDFAIDLGDGTRVELRETHPANTNEAGATAERFSGAKGLGGTTLGGTARVMVASIPTDQGKGVAFGLIHDQNLLSAKVQLESLGVKQDCSVQAKFFICQPVKMPAMLTVGDVSTQVRP